MKNKRSKPNDDSGYESASSVDSKSSKKSASSKRSKPQKGKNSQVEFKERPVWNPDLGIMFKDWINQTFPHYDPAMRFTYRQYQRRNLPQCNECAELTRISYDDTHYTKLEQFYCPQCREAGEQIMNLEWKLIGKRDKEKRDNANTSKNTSKTNYPKKAH